MHILSILDIKKMIPVPTDCYERIDFNELEDIRYKDLFQKGYAFCLKIKTKILIKVEKIYKNQKKTGIIRRANCNFSKLEKAMLDWKQQNKGSQSDLKSKNFNRFFIAIKRQRK